MNFEDYGFYRMPPIDFDNLADPRRSKNIFSRVFLALFTCIAASYVALFTVEILLLTVLGEETYLYLMQHPIYSLLISSGCQYLIGFPAFFLITSKGEKWEKREKKKMSFKHLFFSLLACQTMMMVGNVIGLTVNGMVGGLVGVAPENTIETLVNETPIWLIFILVVVVGPTLEELVFRKVMIDRLAIFGDRSAILVSSVAFGFFHGNLYQLFYAFFIGLVLGYVYTKTGKVIYTVILHGIINFFGSIVSPYAAQIQEKLMEYSEIIMAEGEVLPIGFLVSLLIYVFYSNLITAAFAGGIVVLIFFIRRGGLINISDRKGLFVPRGKLFAYSTFNVGAIIFYAASIMIMLAGIIFPLIQIS